MNAKEFIKQYGWEKAKEVLSKGVALRSTYFDTKKHEFFDGTPVRKGIDVVRVSFLSDLKHLVDAWELIGWCGGLDKLKYIIRLIEGNIFVKDDIKREHTIDDLKKAIELVESVK